MKNVFLMVILFVSVFSCNKEKKTNYISVDDEGKTQTIDKNISEVTPIDTLAYADRGLKYALSTQAVLGKNLMAAIEKSGTTGAMSFCNEQAYPLTDSMSVVQNARLKRVSDKPRNSKNQANAEELEHIQTFKDVIANNESPHPIVSDSDTSVQVYYPILTNAMCLQCHGKPDKAIAPNTMKKLALLYPNDKAIGYDLNEVRGIWTVTIDK